MVANKRSKPIVVEANSAASIEDIWNAITNLDLMREWYFDILEDFNPEVGFSTSFHLSNEGRSFTHQWRVTSVIPNQAISYDWTFAEYNGRSSSLWEIIDKGDTRLIRITNRGLDSFPENVPEFTVDSCRGGWVYFIERLVNFLD